MTDTNPHIDEYHSFVYEEIYKILNSGDFPTEDENLEVYQNIQKGDIHLITTLPTLFPLKKVVQW